MLVVNKSCTVDSFISLAVLFLQKDELVNEKAVPGVVNNFFQASNNGDFICSVTASLIEELVKFSE